MSAEEEEDVVYSITEEGLATLLAAEKFILQGDSLEEASDKVGCTDPLELRILMLLAGNVTLSDVEGEQK